MKPELGISGHRPRIPCDREIKAQSREKNTALHKNRLRHQCDTSPPLTFVIKTLEQVETSKDLAAPYSG